MAENDDGKKDGEDEWPVISRYTAEDAVRDGVFVHIGYAGKEPVYITSSLFAEGYKDFDKRAELVNRGLELLRNLDPEDTDYLCLRVIEKNKIWVTRTGDGYTFMKPEDY